MNIAEKVVSSSQQNQVPMSVYYGC